jgi:crotonobetainyl-CoA:carnitine CoA-transferase CaiB-like acyl-CoA transferase
MSVNGEADGPPLRLGIPIVDLATGLHAFSGILLAIHERDRSGLGQLVDCSLFNTALALLHPQAASWFVDGTVAGRSGSAHPIIAPYDTYPTQTGLVFIGAGSDAQFRTLTRVLDLSELADDPRFGSNPERRRHTAALRDLLAARLADLDAAAVAQALLDEGVPSSPIYNVAQALSSPQTESQGMVVTAGTHYRGVGIPVKLERTPGEIRTAPGQLGADSFNVLAEIGLDATVVRTLMAEGVVVGPDGPAE